MPGRRKARQHSRGLNFLALPSEIRILIYRQVVCDLDRTDVDSWFMRPSERRRQHFWFNSFCRASPRIAREAWPVFFDATVPSLDCVGGELRRLVKTGRRSPRLGWTRTREHRLIESLGAFRHIRLYNLCASYFGRLEYISFWLRKRQVGDQVGLHMQIEDIATALRAEPWWPDEAKFRIATMRHLLWNPRVVPLIWSGPFAVPQNVQRSFGRKRYDRNRVTAQEVEHACRVLDIDPRKIVQGWQPGLMRLGSRWAMELPVDVSTDVESS